MHPLTELTPGYFCIEMPEEASTPTIIYTNNDKWLTWMIHSGNESDFESSCLGDGNWQLLGICSEKEIDFDVEGLVEKTQWSFPERHTVYRNYLQPLEEPNSVSKEWRQAWGISFEDKYDSFRSLLASKGLYWVNPFGEKILQFNSCHAKHKNIEQFIMPYSKYKEQWQAAESKRITGKLVVLKLLK